MGEAHYRDLMLRLQDECARVVTALETQLQCVQQHNTLLLHELASVRALAQEWRETSAMQSEEMTSKLDETSTLRHANEELRRAVEADRTRLEQQQKDWTLFLAQWEAEREQASLESQRASKQLKDAQMQVTEEQRRNAHMTQEIQLLQCRVESAVKTSRSFEQRLQHVTERRREEKNEWEAELTRLRRKLDDKREQAKYLAEALMEKESRPESSRRRRHQQQQQHDDAHVVPGLSSDRERLRTRRREVNAAPPASSAAPSRPEYVNKRAHGAEEKPDRYTYAPTSPTASSPAMSPPMTPQHHQQREQQRQAYNAKPTGLPHLTKDQLNHTRMTTRTTMTTESTASSSPRSERLQRELSGLRRKLEACMLQVETDTTL